MHICRKKLSKMQSSSNKLAGLVALRAQELCSVVGIQSPRLAFRAQGWHSEPKVGLQSRGTTNWQVAVVAERCLPRQWRRPELTLDTLFPHICGMAISALRWRSGPKNLHSHSCARLHALSYKHFLQTLPTRWRAAHVFKLAFVHATARLKQT